MNSTKRHSRFRLNDLWWEPKPEPDYAGRIPVGGRLVEAIDRQVVRINTASIWWPIGCICFMALCFALADILLPGTWDDFGHASGVLMVLGASFGLCCAVFETRHPAEMREHVRQGGKLYLRPVLYHDPVIEKLE